MRFFVKVFDKIDLMAREFWKQLLHEFFFNALFYSEKIVSFSRLVLRKAMKIKMVKCIDEFDQLSNRRLFLLLA